MLGGLGEGPGGHILPNLLREMLPQRCSAPTLAALGIPTGSTQHGKIPRKALGFVQGSVVIFFPRRLRGLLSSHAHCFVISFQECLGNQACAPSSAAELLLKAAVPWQGHCHWFCTQNRSRCTGVGTG